MSLVFDTTYLKHHGNPVSLECVVLFSSEVRPNTRTSRTSNTFPVSQTQFTVQCILYFLYSMLTKGLLVTSIHNYLVSFHFKGFSDRPKSAMYTRQLSYDSVPNRQGLYKSYESVH